jgi:hypothetical protein
MKELDFKTVVKVEVKVVDENNNEIPNVTVTIGAVKIGELLIPQIEVDDVKE